MAAIREHSVSSVLAGETFSVDSLEADRMGREIAAAWNAGDLSYSTTEQIFKSFYRWFNHDPQEHITRLVRRFKLQLT